MEKLVYVSGHQNPDSDSICSAIGYTYLLNKINRYHAKAVRLGNVSNETAFILDYFKVEHPEFLADVYGSGDQQKSVVLVDHNERGQSILGIEDAEILEVIDHHRIADFQTTGPLYFRAEPVGCTATIVLKLFDEQQVEVPSSIAGVLLGAIISDSLLFKSPTCTKQDIDAANRLALIANVDVESFGMDMFKAGTSLVGKSICDIYHQDYKKFTLNEGVVAGVGQVNTMDMEGFMPYKEEMLVYMAEQVTKDKLAFSMLLLTDVIQGSSEVLLVGPEIDNVCNAFDIQLEQGQATMDGVISRKKQVVPIITEAFK